MKAINLAIVGATGLVGSTILEVLESSHLEIDSLTLYASHRSAGKKMLFKNKSYELVEINEAHVKASQYDLVLMAAGGDISKKYAPLFIENNAYVIDNSSYFRMDASVPLIIPEVNPDDMTKETKLIANPNCSTIQSVLALDAIHKLFGIKRIVYNTYQSVSGSGLKGISDLENDTTENYPYPIKHNVLPQIDDFLENAYTKEEMKMIEETKKILHDDGLRITATAVRVPIINTHAVSINVQTEKPVNLPLLKKVYQNTQGIKLVDDISKNQYPLAQVAQGSDWVYVGRIREDFSIENGLNLWCVADNIRKGAASNSVQIAECMKEKGLI